MYNSKIIPTFVGRIFTIKLYMKKDKLSIGQIYYYLETPDMSIDNIAEWDEYVPEIREFVYVKHLSMGRREECDQWFAVKDSKERLVLRDEDIEKNLFEKRSDAEQFQKEFCQNTITELNKHIERIQKTRDMFVDRLVQFEMANYGPLFNQNDNNNDNTTTEEK